MALSANLDAATSTIDTVASAGRTAGSASKLPLGDFFKLCEDHFRDKEGSTTSTRNPNADPEPKTMKGSKVSGSRLAIEKSKAPPYDSSAARLLPLPLTAPLIPFVVDLPGVGSATGWLGDVTDAQPSLNPSQHEIVSAGAQTIEDAITDGTPKGSPFSKIGPEFPDFAAQRQVDMPSPAIQAHSVAIEKLATGIVHSAAEEMDCPRQLSQPDISTERSMQNLMNGNAGSVAEKSSTTSAPQIQSDNSEATINDMGVAASESSSGTLDDARFATQPNSDSIQQIPAPGRSIPERSGRPENTTINGRGRELHKSGNVKAFPGSGHDSADVILQAGNTIASPLTGSLATSGDITDPFNPATPGKSRTAPTQCSGPASSAAITTAVSLDPPTNTGKEQFTLTTMNDTTILAIEPQDPPKIGVEDVISNSSVPQDSSDQDTENFSRRKDSAPSITTASSLVTTASPLTASHSGQSTHAPAPSQHPESPLATDAASLFDAAPNPHSSISSVQQTLSNPAHLAQIVSKAMQSEMRIGLNTLAFGNVQVHTTVHASDVGVQIGSERGDLRNLMTNDLPGIAHTLREQNIHLTEISFQQQGMAFSADSSSAGNHSQPQSFRSSTAVFELPIPESTPLDSTASQVQTLVQGRLSVIA